MAKISARQGIHRAGLLLLGLAACQGSGPTPEVATRDGISPKEPELEFSERDQPFHDSAASPSVIAYWAHRPEGIESRDSVTLLVEGRGPDATFASPRLVLEGLDGRVVEVELEAVELAEHERREFEVDLRGMPLQGVSHSVTLTAAVQYAGPDKESSVTVRSEPLGFHFDDAFERAFVYDQTTMVTELRGGVMAEDPRSVVGRLQVDGEFVDLETLRARHLRQEAKWLGEAPENIVPPDVSTIEFTYAFPEPEVGETQKLEHDASESLGFAAEVGPAAAPGPNPPGNTPPWNPPPSIQCLLFPWDCCQGDHCIDVCADWTTDYVDASSYGPQTEDYAVGSYSQSVDASYAPYEISKFTCAGPYCWVNTVAEGQLGADGCARVDLAPGSGYSLRLSTELRHGSGGHTYPVHYYPQNTNEANVGLVKVSKGFNRYPNGLAVPPLSQISMPSHPATNAAAMISRTLVSGALAGQSTGFLTKAGLGCLGYEDVGIPPTDACAGWELKTGPYVKPDNSPGNLRWKFVLAHEAGHVAQRRGMGTPANAYCFTADGNVTGDCENHLPDHPNAPPSCSCDHVSGSNSLHCLQSYEHTTAAQVEGWAQFFAARVWNDAGPGCIFNYYKQFREDDGSVEQPPYKVSCDSNVNWRDNHCFGSWGGTEYDWLQFFWNLHAVGSYKYSTLDIFNAYENACGGSCSGEWISWSELSNGAANLFSNAKHAVLLADGDVTGVDGDKF